MATDEDFQVYNELLSEQAERELAGERQPDRVYLPPDQLASLILVLAGSEEVPILGEWPNVYVEFAGVRYFRAPRYVAKAY